MNVSHSLRASVFAFAAVLGAPALAQDIIALRPVGDAVAAAPETVAPAPVLVVVGIPAAPAELPAESAAAAAPAEEPADTLKVVSAVSEPAEVIPAVTVPALAPPALPAATPPALPVEVTPPPLPQIPAYYVGIDGQPVGPLDEAALREMVAGGELTETSLVWTDGMQDWSKAGEVADLKDLLEDAPKAAALGTGKDGSKAPAATPVAAPGAGAVGVALPGNWHVDGMIPVDGLGMGDADILQVFNPDGTYEASGTILAVVPGMANYPVEIVVSTVGRWTVVEGPDGQGQVTVVATTYVSIPELGVPVTANTGSDSFLVQVVDGDTLVVDGTEWSRIAA